MTTQADEWRAEIARLDEGIAWAENCAAKYPTPENVELCQDYAASLRKRKAQLQGYLEREEARLVKPQPEGVRLGAYDV